MLLTIQTCRIAGRFPSPQGATVSIIALHSGQVRIKQYKEHLKSGVMRSWKSSQWATFHLKLRGCCQCVTVQCCTHQAAGGELGVSASSLSSFRVFLFPGLLCPPGPALPPPHEAHHPAAAFSERWSEHHADQQEQAEPDGMHRVLASLLSSKLGFLTCCFLWKPVAVSTRCGSTLLLSALPHCCCSRRQRLC